MDSESNLSDVPPLPESEQERGWREFLEEHARHERLVINLSKLYYLLTALCVPVGVMSTAAYFWEKSISAFAVPFSCAAIGLTGIVVGKGLSGFKP